MVIAEIIKDKLSFVNPAARSQKVLKNIINSFIVKIFSTVITLSLVPVSLMFVDKATYGVWLTIASVISWCNIFDFGLTTGLTNRLTEAFANKNEKLARIYLSTTYAILFITIIILSTIYIFINSFINWNTVFNTSIDPIILRTGIHLTFISFCLLFLTKPISSLVMAKQKHFLGSLILVIANAFSLLMIWLFAPFTTNTFLFLLIVMSFSYPLFLFLFSVYLYISKYKSCKPGFSLIDFKLKKVLFGIGLKFFIIQLSVIVILTSNNFIISHLIDNESVTVYNIALRYFSIAAIFQMMFINPLWTAFTDAYTLKDFQWIKNVMNKIRRLNIFICALILFMFLAHKLFYHVWIGDKISIPFSLNIFFALYYVIVIYKEGFNYFINGVGRLNLQTLFSIVAIIFHFPLCLLFMKTFALGMNGLMAVNIFWMSISLILWRWQYGIIINKRSESKIWL